MKEAVIVAACRTAVGKAPRGALKDVRPEAMACAVLGDVVKRASDLDPMLIDDLVVGCTFPEAVQGLNIGTQSGQCHGMAGSHTRNDRQHGFALQAWRSFP